MADKKKPSKEALEKFERDRMPPQWRDRKGRPNEKHPKYQFDPSREHRDYREFAQMSREERLSIPKNYAEKVAKDRLKIKKS